MPQGSLARKFSAIFAGNIVSFTIAVLFPVVLVRLFSTEEYGSYYQMTACAGVFELGFALGLRPTLLFFSAKDPEQHLLHSFNTLLVNSVVGFILIVVALLFREQIATWLKIGALADLIPLMAAYSMFEIFSAVLTAHFMVFERAKEVAWVTMIYAASRAVVLLLAAILTRSPRYTLLALVAWSFAKYLVTLWFLFHGRWRELPRSLASFLPKLREQLRYALPLGVSGFFQKGIVTIDRAVVSAMYGVQAVAVYQVGFFRIPLVSMFYNTMAEVIVPRLTQHLDAGQASEARRIWISAIEKSALLFFPVSFYFMLMATEFTRAMFTDKYLDSVPIFQACMVLTAVQAISYGTVIRASGETSFFLKANALVSLLFAVLIWPMGKQFNVLGIALTVVIAQSVYSSLVVYNSLTLLKSRMTDFPWVKLLLMLIVSGATNLFVTQYVRSFAFANDWIALILATLAIPLSIGVILVLRIVRLPLGELLQWRLGA